MDSGTRKSPSDGQPEKTQYRGKFNEDSIRPKVTLPCNMEPTFYIGGGNGVAMIEETLTGLGWRRIKDKSDENYRLKWCELKSAINYNVFRDGDQIVNHIPNCNLLTNKQGLLNSLQEYDRVCAATKKKAPKLDFVPETYKLSDPRDKELFTETYKEGDIWICKPTGKNQGKGIYLVRTPEEVTQLLQETEEEDVQGKTIKPASKIIQRYIKNPLLLDGKKFDLRSYMLIANTVPYLLLYHKGYVRVSMIDYDNDSENIAAHLTNQYIQKKDPMYKDVKEETTWSMDRFNDYINKNVAPDKNLEKNWVYNTLTNRMKQITSYCFNSVKHKLQNKVGYFDLYGLDFMVDDDMKVWLIEINVNPCLAINCEALKEVIPGVVKETLYLAIECFEKTRRGRPLMPLQTLNNFQILHNGCSKSNNSKNSRVLTASPNRLIVMNKTNAERTSNLRSKSSSPLRRTRSLSPAKTNPRTDTKAPIKIPGPAFYRVVPKATTLSPQMSSNKSQTRQERQSEAGPNKSQGQPYTSQNKTPWVKRQSFQKGQPTVNPDKQPTQSQNKPIASSLNRQQPNGTGKNATGPPAKSAGQAKQPATDNKSSNFQQKTSSNQASPVTVKKTQESQQTVAVPQKEKPQAVGTSKSVDRTATASQQKPKPVANVSNVTTSKDRLVTEKIEINKISQMKSNEKQSQNVSTKQNGQQPQSNQKGASGQSKQVLSNQTKMAYASIKQPLKNVSSKQPLQNNQTKNTAQEKQTTQKKINRGDKQQLEKSQTKPAGAELKQQSPTQARTNTSLEKQPNKVSPKPPAVSPSPGESKVTTSSSGKTQSEPVALKMTHVATSQKKQDKNKAKGDTSHRGN